MYMIMQVAPENRLKYLCLFGDASFDYKDRIRVTRILFLHGMHIVVLI